MDETLAWRDEAEPTAEYRDLLVRRHEPELHALFAAAWLVDTVRGARVAIARQVVFAAGLLALFLRWSPLRPGDELDRSLVTLLPPLVLAGSLVAVLLASAAAFRWLTSRAHRAPAFMPLFDGSLRVQIERLERGALLPFVPRVRVRALASVAWPLAACLAVTLVVFYGLQQAGCLTSCAQPLHDRFSLANTIAFVFLSHALVVRSLHTMVSCEAQIATREAVTDFYFARARNEVFALVLSVPALGVFFSLLPLFCELVGS